MSVASSTTILVQKGLLPRLLNQLCDLATKRFGRLEPAERYASWALRYILFHGKLHARLLGVCVATRPTRRSLRSNPPFCLAAGGHGGVSGTLLRKEQQLGC
jgi:hypothetical protein